MNTKPAELPTEHPSEIDGGHGVHRGVHSTLRQRHDLQRTGLTNDAQRRNAGGARAPRTADRTLTSPNNAPSRFT
ncbi:hypothetical protein [Rhodococcus sp. EPR-157]|uniref:hypothetical protein n=1 Tax=Rhodococcus sp. EPR-157 TaxID=1813677 RepID=UPI0012E8CBE1|nr:hypothetical protein [Rhodococcus sp. EPR-157]